MIRLLFLILLAVLVACRSSPPTRFYALEAVAPETAAEKEKGTAVTPFGEMARNVITQDLQQRLPPGTVIPPDVPAPANTRGVVVEILSFSRNESGQVVLACDWSLLEGSPPLPLFVRTVNLTESGGSSASNQVSAMSRLLGKLADQIAASIETASADQPG